MSNRFLDYARYVDSRFGGNHESRVSQWDAETLQRANALASMLDKAGCKTSEMCVCSEITEGLPQTTRFLFLKAFMDSVILPSSSRGIKNLELTDERASNILRKMNESLSEDEKRYIFSTFAKQMGQEFLHLLDEGYIPELPEATGWGLMEFDSEGQPTDRLLCALHEDYESFDESI